jgi:hypothetical protein
MVSLVDIVPQTRVVHTSVGELELRGLGLRQLADLLLQFPLLRNLVTAGAPEVDAETLIRNAPDAVATIIAQAAGQPAAAGAIADGALAVTDLLDCLIAIRDLTFGQPGPFGERLRNLTGQGNGIDSSYGAAAVTSSPPPPSN